MSFLQNLGKKNTVEHLTLTTTGATAESDSFSTLEPETVTDVVIQNLSAVGAYVTFGIEAVVATNSDLYLAAGASVSWDNAAFAYFSVIRATTDVIVRITGVGRM